MLLSRRLIFFFFRHSDKNGVWDAVRWKKYDIAWHIQLLEDVFIDIYERVWFNIYIVVVSNRIIFLVFQ